MNGPRVVLAALVAALLSAMAPESLAGDPPARELAKGVGSLEVARRTWRVRNMTTTDMTVWMRVLDAPDYGAASFDSQGQAEAKAGEFATFSASLLPRVSGQAPTQAVKALVVFQPKGGNPHWLIKEYGPGDTSPVVYIEEDLLRARQDRLFIRNNSSEPVTLRYFGAAMPNDKAEEDKDFHVRTTSAIKTDELVVPPGKTLAWLVMDHHGAIGAGAREVTAVLRSKPYEGLCSITWTGHIEGVATINDDHIAALAKYKDQALKAEAERERAARARVEETRREELRESQERKARAEEESRRRWRPTREYARNYPSRPGPNRSGSGGGDAGEVLVALLAGLFVAAVINEAISGPTWTPEPNEDDSQRQADFMRRQRQFHHERWEREAKEADERGEPRPPEPPPP